MLEEYKSIYMESAARIDYTKLTRDEIAFKYIENEGTDLADSYLSALILKFWNVIVHNYNTRSYNDVTEEDAYSWVILGILDALKGRPWMDPNSSLYNDPKGPEKAINIKCFQNKCRYYQVLNCDKRKVQKDKVSLEAISEDCSDDYFLPYFDTSEVNDKFLCEYIKNYHDNKQYLKFYILDAIIHGNVLVDNKVDLFKLKKFIKNIDESYCSQLSLLYNIPVEDIQYSSSIFTNIPAKEFNKRSTKELMNLSRDKDLFQYILLQ